MTTWIEDANGNRCSVEYFGDHKSAQSALDSLKDCRNCINCSGCSGLKNPKVVGPFRSDGYQFCMGESGSIHAGCRQFPTMAEARNHWQLTCGNTPLGKETMIILDMIEKLAELRG